MKPLYLIQTGKIETDLMKKDLSTISLGYRGFDKFVNFNYMGSAEYEFGASGKSFKRIVENFDKYELYHTEILNCNGIPMYIFCNKDQIEAITLAIRVHVEGGLRSDILFLKEPSDMFTHIKNTKDVDVYRRKRSNFWWDFENDWMAFFGADDRVIAFTAAMKNDYKRYMEANNET